MTQKQDLFSIFFIGFLALLPVLAVDVPRFLGFGPALAGVIGLGFYCFLFRQRPVLPPQLIAASAGIAALAGASCLWAQFPEITYGKIPGVVALLITGTALPCAILTIQYRHVQKHVWMIPVGVIAAATLITLELGLEGPLYKIFRTGQETAQLPVYDHVFNRAAVTVVLSSFAAFQLMKTHLSFVRGRWVFFAAMGLMLLCVESQSAQLAMLTGLVFALFFPYRSRKAWTTITLLVAALIMGAPFLSIWAFKHLAPTLNEAPFLGAGHGFAGARLEIWDYVSRYALQKPWLGHGLEATRAVKDFASAEIYQEGKSILHPHNFALQAWMEFGAAGAAAASAFCAWLLHAMRTHLTPEQARVALPTFIAALSVAATGYGMWQAWWVGMLFLVASFCLLAINSIKYREKVGDL